MRTLREILKKKGITQEVAASALGIHVNNIKRYDDLSNRSLEELKKLSDSIGVNLSELIYEGTGFTIEESILDDYSKYDDAVNKPTVDIMKRVTDSNPLRSDSYEFMQLLFEERKRNDEINAELIRQNGELIELLKTNKKSHVHQDESADFADAK